MFRRRKPLWLMLLMAAVIIAGWLAVFRHQTQSIDCATGATEPC